MRHRVSAIEVDIHEYLELVQPVAQKHGVALYAGDHQGIASVSDTLIQQFDAARGLAARRDDAARRLKLQEQAAAAADDEHGIAETALAEARAEWGAWLMEHGLREEFDPDTTLEFMARVETARASLGGGPADAEQGRGHREGPGRVPGVGGDAGPDHRPGPRKPFRWLRPRRTP